MPAELDNLLTRRGNILAELAAMGPTASGGKPTYAIDGQHVDHTGYRRSLYDELAAIDQRLATLAGPSETGVQGRT